MCLKLNFCNECNVSVDRDEELAVKLSEHSVYLPAVRLLGSRELALAAAATELLLLVAETRAGLAVLLATPTVQVPSHSKPPRERQENRQIIVEE